MSRLWWRGDRHLSPRYPPRRAPTTPGGPRHSHPTSEARAEMATLMDEMEEHVAAQREVEALLNAE